MLCLKSRFVSGVLPSKVYLGLAVWTPAHNNPADTPVEESIKSLDSTESNIKHQESLLSTEAPQPPHPPWRWLPVSACCCCSWLASLRLILSRTRNLKKMTFPRTPWTSPPGFWPPTTPPMRSCWKETCSLPKPGMPWSAGPRAACGRKPQTVRWWSPSSWAGSSPPGRFRRSTVPWSPSTARPASASSPVGTSTTTSASRTKADVSPLWAEWEADRCSLSTGGAVSTTESSSTRSTTLWASSTSRPGATATATSGSTGRTSTSGWPTTSTSRTPTTWTLPTTTPPSCTTEEQPSPSSGGGTASPPSPMPTSGSARGEACPAGTSRGSTVSMAANSKTSD